MITCDNEGHCMSEYCDFNDFRFTVRLAGLPCAILCPFPTTWDSTLFNVHIASYSQRCWAPAV